MSRQIGERYHRLPPTPKINAKEPLAIHVLATRRIEVHSLPRMLAESAHSSIQNTDPLRRAVVRMKGKNNFAKPPSDREICRKRRSVSGTPIANGMARMRTGRGGEGKEEEAKNVT